MKNICIFLFVFTIIAGCFQTLPFDTMRVSFTEKQEAKPTPPKKEEKKL